MARQTVERPTPLAERAEQAYQTAERRIRHAKQFDFQSLDLSDLKFLERLPDEISELTGARRLLLNGTLVHDLQRIENLSRLVWLNLDNTQVNDIAPLAKLTELLFLSADRTKISDLSPLRNLHQLRILSLRRTLVRNIEPLALLEQLIDLDLYWTPVRNLSGVSGLKGLTRLNLERTKVEDIQSLSALTGLRELNLYWTRVSSLAPLSKHSHLQYLQIGRTRVSDLSPIAGMTGLADAASESPYGVRPFEFLDTPAYRSEREKEKRTQVRLISLPEPHRTVGLINSFRAASGLEPFYPSGYKFESREQETIPRHEPGSEGLKQTSASYSFSFVGGLLEAHPQVGTPSHLDVTADIHAEVREKLSEAQERLGNAPARVR